MSQQNNEYFRIAVLLDRFGLTLDQIAQLTPWQENNLYFAKRDEKTGELAPPKQEAVSVEEMALPLIPKDETPLQRFQKKAQSLTEMHMKRFIPTDNFTEQMAKLRAQYAEETAPPPLPPADVKTLDKLKDHLAAGHITQDQYHEAVARFSAPSH